MAREHEIEAPVFADHNAMLESVEPDVAVIALWTGLHLPVLCDCVQAGVRGVLCEKPMAPTWGEALQMAELARENNVTLNFCHQRRFNPGVMKARELIEAGTFGAVRRIELFSPVNALDCGVHSLDFGFMFNRENPVQWVIGQVEPGEIRRSFDIPRADYAVAFYRHENGVFGSLEVGGERELPTGARILCEDGMLEVGWGGQFGRAAVFSDPKWTPPATGEAAGLEPTARALINSMETGEESELDVAKSLRANEVVFALYESARRRDRIRLPLQTRDSAFLAMIENGEIAPRVDPLQGY